MMHFYHKNGLNIDILSFKQDQTAAVLDSSPEACTKPAGLSESFIVLGTSVVDVDWFWTSVAS